MANKVYGFIALTGGGAGSLDSIDGTALVDKDMAVGVVNGVAYEYYLNATSAAAESSPHIIAPDANGGAKRWIRALPSNPYNTLANDATPSISSGNLWITGGTTTITNFDDGYIGQTITIIAEHSITITDGTNIFLNGSANFVMAATDTLTLIQKPDGKWYEIARSDN
jgi:hypothetical protein